MAVADRPAADSSSERHYAWVILAVAFFGVLGAQGVRLAFGAFVEPWEESFNISRGTVGLVSLIGFLFYGATQPLVGKLTDRVNIPRMFSFGLIVIAAGLALTALSQSPLALTLAFGVVASIGFGISASVAASVLIARWFVAKRGMAFGILEAGFGAGQLLLAPLALFTIGRFGWRPTMWLFAFLLAVVLAPIMLALLRDSPESMGMQPLGGPDITFDANPEGGRPDLLRRREFWYLGIPFFVCGITTTGMIDTHLIPFAHDHGNGDAITSAAVGVLAVFNIIGTAGAGLLVDRYDPRRMLGWLYAIRAVSLIMVLGLNQGFWLIQFGVLFGIVDFATVAPTQTLVSRYFGAKSMGFVFGLVLASHQVGSAIGSYVPARMYDLTGSYTSSFFFAALTLVVASGLSFWLPNPGPLLGAPVPETADV